MYYKTLDALYMHCLQCVPAPVCSFVTRWQQDPLARMAYSYVPVGCSGSAYDVLAETVGDKVHFAGEVSNEQCPQ